MKLDERSRTRLNLILGEGALDANPREVKTGERLTLKAPLRPGYFFVGWIGEDINAPQRVLTVVGDDRETLQYTAVWQPIKEYEVSDDPNYGVDDGIPPLAGNPGERPTSKPSRVGLHGEDLYLVKTVYTDIAIDGERDPAYDYGAHFRGLLPNDKKYYEGRNTMIDLWVVRGQDGRAYFYGEITDEDIVVNHEMLAFKPHYCDAVHLYLEGGNAGMQCGVTGVIVATEDPSQFKGRPKNCVVRRTAEGFAFEIAVDNMGGTFSEGDELGFALYYNDTNRFVSMEQYERRICRLPTRQNPASDEFHYPLAAENDALRFTTASATGRAKTKVIPAVTGDLLQDLMSGAREMSLFLDPLATAHTILDARRLRKILGIVGARVEIEIYGAQQASDAFPMFCGRTEDAISTAREAALPYHAYELFISADRICLTGWKEQAMARVCGLLESAFAYVAAGGRTEELSTTYGGVLEGVPGEEIPRMEGLTLVTDAADGSYLLQRNRATRRDFDAYCRALRANGFRLYDAHRMSTVECATYCNDTVIVNVTYGCAKGDRTLRAVVDPRSETTLPVMRPETYAPRCQSTITQLAPDCITWMCYAVRLDNGEFLIIDSGGGSFRYLHDRLLELNEGRHVVVAAWLFTHFHIDHVGAFVALVQDEELMKDITVRSIIYNFPQRQVLDTARASAGDMRNMALWKGIVERTGATVYKARTGQRYRFANAELEMLFTFEDLQLFRIMADRSNPTSHIFSMKIAGQRFMILGDACGEATTLCIKRYGRDLKSDFVQLSHHGMGDGGTDPDFYPLVNAPYVFWPAPTSLTKAGKSEARALEHAEEFFKNSPEDTTLLLPYKKS